jgi:hypothetical protein
MNTTQIFVVSALVGTILLCGSASTSSGAEELSRKWSSPGASGPERAAALNETFTNGTPMSAVVAVLGSNYTRVSPISIPGPQPRNTSGLIYRFAEQEIVIVSTAATNANPVSGTFIRAAYMRPGTNGIPRNYIYIGQPPKD